MVPGGRAGVIAWPHGNRAPPKGAAHFPPTGRLPAAGHEAAAAHAHEGTCGPWRDRLPRCALPAGAAARAPEQPRQRR